MEEIKIDIFGRVQGVRFRHFVKEKADELKINGYVRNREDGSVSVIAQGDRVSLQKLLSEVQEGPKLSKIAGVSYIWQNPWVKYNDFIIALDKGLIEDQKSSFFNLGRNLLNLGDKIPKHIAIIPDGNRRWAQQKGLNSSDGHKKAAQYENLSALLEETERLGVKYLTLWLFSTENWKRTKKEIDFLFSLVLKFSKEFGKEAKRKGIRFRHIGRKDRIPKKVLDIFEKLEKDTRKFDRMNLQVCLDYGGRDEIARAINKIIKSGVNEIKEEDLANYLDSADIPDPELIIRTSGEHRMSGFMPFQSAYSEFYFTDVKFPDFGPKELRKAVEEFARRKRNFGK